MDASITQHFGLTRIERQERFDDRFKSDWISERGRELLETKMHEVMAEMTSDEMEDHYGRMQDVFKAEVKEKPYAWLCVTSALEKPAERLATKQYELQSFEEMA